MRFRPRLSYANVAATLALVLAVGGGTVYAAAQLGKNDVRSRNIAPNAVKTPDLAKNAVTSPKIRNRTIQASDIAAGVIRTDVADVTASISSGNAPIPPSASPTSLLLTGRTAFTPQEGQVSALAAEAEFDVATTTPANDCRPFVGLFVNGQPTRLFLAPDPEGPPYSTTVQRLGGYDADGPFGLVNPGTPLVVSAKLEGDTGNNCTTDSKLNSLEIRVVQIR